MTTLSRVVKELSVVGAETRQNGITESMRRMGRPPRNAADREMVARMGTYLRWVREANGWSQAQAGDAVGVTQSAWSLYERGLRWPDQFEAVRLIAKLRISREYLLSGSLEGVERDLAIRLAAAHPELATPRSMDSHKDTRRS